MTDDPDFDSVLSGVARSEQFETAVSRAVAVPRTAEFSAARLHRMRELMGLAQKDVSDAIYSALADQFIHGKLPPSEPVLTTSTPRRGKSWFEEQLALRHWRAATPRVPADVWFEEAPPSERYEVVTFEREGRPPVQFGRLGSFRVVTSPLLIDESQRGQTWRDRVVVAGRRLGKTAMLQSLQQPVHAQRPPGRRTVVAMAVDALLR